MRRVTLVTLGSAGLRAGKSPAFLVLRGLARSGPMALLLGDLPWVEQVELDSAGDAGDAGDAGLAGGEVPLPSWSSAGWPGPGGRG